jgi:cytochrome c-type biogenesis protein CcmF
LVDSLGGGKVSVGPPFFNAVFVPLTAILVSFMVFGPLTSWQQMKDTRQYRPLIVAGLVSVIAGLVWPTQMLGAYSIASALGTVLALWLVLGTAIDIRQRILEYGSVRVMSRKVGAGFFGMWTAHIGVAVTIFGVAMVENHTEHRDLRMGPGDAQALGPYEVRFMQLEKIQGPNYAADRATFEVWEGTRLYQAVMPEKRVYNASQMVMTEAAIDPGFTRDLYIALGEPLGDGDWAVRLSIKPFVDWIWAGSFLMGFGGIVAITDRRYRRVRARKASLIEDRVAPA